MVRGIEVKVLITVQSIFSVLAIQAKKKRYKAPKTRMRPEDSKTKPKR